LRELLISQTITQTLEVLFFKNNGNGLSPQYHKKLYPGETGHDQATGLVENDYWGTQGSSAIGSGASFGGGGGGASPGNVRLNEFAR
jgi:hypothetical protein